MAQYDPQRSRTRHRKADDEGPAPVDALLGPAGPGPSSPAEPVVVETAVPGSEAAEPVVVEPGAVQPEWDPDLSFEPASPGFNRRLAAAAAALVAVVTLLWLLARRRRGDGGNASED